GTRAQRVLGGGRRADGVVRRRRTGEEGDRGGDARGQDRGLHRGRSSAGVRDGGRTPVRLTPESEPGTRASTSARRKKRPAAAGRPGARSRLPSAQACTPGASTPVFATQST